MITLTEEQFKEMIEAAHRAGQYNQGHCDPSAYEAMIYYECEVKKIIIPDVGNNEVAVCDCGKLGEYSAKFQKILCDECFDKLLYQTNC